LLLFAVILAEPSLAQDSREAIRRLEIQAAQDRVEFCRLMGVEIDVNISAYVRAKRRIENAPATESREFLRDQLDQMRSALSQVERLSRIHSDLKCG
jgi:hypothetical protein